MFESARLKLTGWYVLFIMTLSLTFSIIIYRLLVSEFQSFEAFNRIRQQRLLERRCLLTGQCVNTFILPSDPELLQVIKQRTVVRLVGLNGVILLGSAVASYVLAGKTLSPIKEMVDRQKRFVSDVSHELRTPLAALRSEIEVNLRDKNLTLSVAKETLESNLEEAKRLQYLSDNLLKLTTFEQQSQLIKVETLSVGQSIAKAVKKVQHRAKEKSIAINVFASDLSIDADAERITELFIILLDNAIKYSPTQTTVSIRSEQKDGNVRVEIEDRGVGIAQKDLPHIFDRFYRADTSRSKSTVEGFGLGLSIAKEIVKSHHGTIRAKSKPGIGTTFIVSFPAKNLSRS